MKVTITTKGASDSSALVDALKNPMNAYDVYQSADNTVDIVINQNHLNRNTLRSVRSQFSPSN